MPARKSLIPEYAKPAAASPYYGDYSALAQQYLRGRPHPVYSVGQGLADVAGAYFEGRAKRKALEKGKAAEDKDYKDLAQAFTTAGNPNLVREQGVIVDPKDFADPAFDQSKVMSSPGATPQDPRVPAQTMTPQDRYQAAIQALAQTNPRMAVEQAPNVAAMAQQFKPQAFTGTLSPNETAFIDGKQVASGPPKAAEDLTPWQKEQVRIQNEQLAATNKRLDAADARANRAKATPYVNRITGNPVKEDPASGSYVDEDKSVKSDDLIPAADFSKDVEKAKTIVAGVQKAEAVKKLADDNKAAFDTSRVNEAKIKRMIPIVGEQQAAKVFTEQENTVRAEVARQSAQIINELYGAALSAGENVRAATFAPSPDDTWQQLKPKLDAALAWARGQEKAIIPSAVSKARGQLNTTTAGGGLTPNSDGSFNWTPPQ